MLAGRRVAGMAGVGFGSGVGIAAFRRRRAGFTAFGRIRVRVALWRIARLRVAPHRPGRAGFGRSGRRPFG